MFRTISLAAWRSFCVWGCRQATPTKRTSQNIDSMPPPSPVGHKPCQRRFATPGVSRRTRSPFSASAGPRPSVDEPFRVIKLSFEVVEGSISYLKDLKTCKVYCPARALGQITSSVRSHSLAAEALYIQERDNQKNALVFATSSVRHSGVQWCS